MTDRLGAIRKLLSHERQDRRRAAAIVLAELGVDDSKSIKALVAALADPEPEVRMAAVEALGQLGAEAALDRMVELLSDPDPRVQALAEAALLAFGDRAAEPLQRLLEGPASSRRAAAALLARLQSAAGLDMLVDAVDGTDLNVLERARKALREQGSELQVPEVRELRRRLDQRLTEARRSRDDVGAAAFLLLLGDLKDDTVVTRLIKETASDAPVPVRKAALTALASALPGTRGRRRDVALEALLACLGEDDEDNLTRPALRAIGESEIPDALGDRLAPLVDAPSAAVRAFALSHLGRVATPESIDTLVSRLLTGAPPVREAAREALSRLPDAAPRVAAALLETDDAERLRTVGEILRALRPSLAPADASATCEAALHKAEAAGAEARSLVETLCAALPETFLEALRERVKRKRKRKKFAEAVALLGLAERCAAFGDEERYLLALLGLLDNAERPARPLRPNDRVCQPFSALLRGGFPVEARLAAERLVETSDLYQIGFAFSESRDEDERDFGHELLELIVEREPESKLGKAASNKLKLGGR